jgi:hypothetical protein
MPAGAASRQESIFDNSGVIGAPTVVTRAHVVNDRSQSAARADGRLVRRSTIPTIATIRATCRQQLLTIDRASGWPMRPTPDNPTIRASREESVTTADRGWYKNVGWMK